MSFPIQFNMYIKHGKKERRNRMFNFLPVIMQGELERCTATRTKRV